MIMVRHKTVFSQAPFRSHSRPISPLLPAMHHKECTFFIKGSSSLRGNEKYLVTTPSRAGVCYDAHLALFVGAPNSTGAAFPPPLQGEWHPSCSKRRPGDLRFTVKTLLLHLQAASCRLQKFYQQNSKQLLRRQMQTMQRLFPITAIKISGIRSRPRIRKTIRIFKR